MQNQPEDNKPITEVHQIVHETNPAQRLRFLV